MKINDNTRTAIKPDGTRIPVVDSKFSFLIQPTKEDIEKGIQGDHRNCMYALTCRRLYGSELVWVTRTLAYVELKNKKGEPELHRFVLKDPARDQVKGFDKGRYSTEEAVIFARPEGSRRLDAIALKERNRRAAGKKHPPKNRAYIKGTAPKRLEPLANSLRGPASGMFYFRPEGRVS